ncbi:MAG: DUF3943 domain-containing protein [bacterium]|nr:DUF3943 domain-containing protein [bacterium]
MKNYRLILLVLLMIVILPDSALAQQAVNWNGNVVSATQDTFLINPVVEKDFVRAAIEVAGLNILVWSYNYYLREGDGVGFRIGIQSWKENMINGFEWDDNNFATNQFGHPYQGNFYYTAARSSGFSFWESTPFVFAGSLGWEFFSETHHASINDWISTSIGGMALGEILHRLAITVRDNEAHGGSRTWRETGGFLIDPVGSLNRYLDGDLTRVHANQPDRFPNEFRTELDVGARTIGEGYIGDTDSTGAYLQFEFDYGDPFFGDMEAPFDHFDFQLQLNFNDSSAIGRIAANGLLGGTFLHESESASHIIAAFHHFDYLNNSKMEFGDQSFGVGFLSRFDTGHGLELRTEVHLSAIILGGTSSDYSQITGRSYDYGPGASAGFSASFGAEGWNFLRVSYEQNFIHAVNGSQAGHFLSDFRARLNIPMTQTLGAGLEYVLQTSDRKYNLYPDVYVRNPQTRVFCTWLLN